MFWLGGVASTWSFLEESEVLLSACVCAYVWVHNVPCRAALERLAFVLCWLSQLLPSQLGQHDSVSKNPSSVIPKHTHCTLEASHTSLAMYTAHKSAKAA